MLSLLASDMPIIAGQRRQRVGASSTHAESSGFGSAADRAGGDGNSREVKMGAGSRSLARDTAFFVALMATSLALGAALAHAFELPNKMGLGRAEYFVVQTIYAGWNRLAFVLAVELAGMLALIFLYRAEPRVLWPVCVALAASGFWRASIVFWVLDLSGQPGDRQLDAADASDCWEALRIQWEYSHLAGAGVSDARNGGSDCRGPAARSAAVMHASARRRCHLSAKAATLARLFQRRGFRQVETIRVVCAHDCPDMCSLLADVENGRVLRVRGDPEQPFTAGFACAKVNRDADLVHSPERIRTPLRRTGAKGEGRFEPISWNAGARRNHRALAADHRGVRAAGAARLRLQRASGADEPRADAGPVPCARRQPADRRDRLRHLLRGSLEHDRRPGRRRRPGSGRAQRPDRRLGRRSRRHQRAFLGQGRGGAAARRRDRRHRPAQEPHRAASRPASADPHRHRRGAGARGHAHPGARRSGRSRLHRGAHDSASTGSKPRFCRGFRRRASPRSPASPKTISRVLPRSTARRSARSSGSARV